MPSVSKKQHNLMAAVAHSPAFAKRVGISQDVGKHFMQKDKDKGKKFADGGGMPAPVRGGDMPDPVRGGDVPDPAVQAAIKNAPAVAAAKTAAMRQAIARQKVERAAQLKRDLAAAQLRREGAMPIGSTPEAMTEQLKRDIVRWRKLILAIGAKAD